MKYQLNILKKSCEECMLMLNDQSSKHFSETRLGPGSGVLDFCLIFNDKICLRI